MTKIRAIFAFAALSAVAAWGQDRTVWRTSADVQEGGRGTIIGTVADVHAGGDQLVVAPDGAQSDQIVIDTDAVSTQYNGFGGTINGSPEIFVGETGFNNVRPGDRVEIRGTATAGVVRAERVTLLGRPDGAPQTGVGQTRTPTSASTPTAYGTTPSTAPDRIGRVEGIVQQINPDEGRLVIVTDRREVLTVRTPPGTPVRYKGDLYRVSNLEVGDRVRVEPEGGAAVTGTEVRARSIEVTQSAQEVGSASRGVGGLSGRVVRVDRTNNVIQLDTGRGTIAVDLRSATDPAGQPVRARDVQASDHVEVSGSYSGATFVASTIRFTDDNGATIVPGAPAQAPPPGDLGVVTIYGTVTRSLTDGPQLVLRDTQNGGRTVRVYALEDLPVRTRTGTYSIAVQLRVNDSVVIKAYRDGDGNYIAQTVRIR
jgi:RNase P/RNase MRP subunit p29